MQGRKDFTPQLFYELSLDRLVPSDNFYRRVNQELDLHFLYKFTHKYYGTQGQESIDPVVFYKIKTSILSHSNFGNQHTFLKINLA
jgi:hypothetical protein